MTTEHDIYRLRKETEELEAQEGRKRFDAKGYYTHETYDGRGGQTYEQPETD